MLLTPHIVRTHEITEADLQPIYIGSQQNLGVGGPPPLIAPQPAAEPAPAAPPAPARLQPALHQTSRRRQPLRGPGRRRRSRRRQARRRFRGRCSCRRRRRRRRRRRPPPVPPAAAGDAAGSAAAPTPAPATPPPPNPPPPPPPPTAADRRRRASGRRRSSCRRRTDVPRRRRAVHRADLDQRRVAALDDHADADLRPDAAARPHRAGRQLHARRRRERRVHPAGQAGNRVDITLARGADATGASGTGLLAAVLFDAIAPGTATLTLSGAATGPGGTAMGLQFTPVTVTVQSVSHDIEDSSRCCTRLRIGATKGPACSDLRCESTAATRSSSCSSSRRSS